MERAGKEGNQVFKEATIGKTYHQKLVAKAKDFIRRVHSDRSVSLEQTLDSLETLLDVVEDGINVTKEDIEKEAL